MYIDLIHDAIQNLSIILLFGIEDQVGKLCVPSSEFDGRFPSLVKLQGFGDVACGLWSSKLVSWLVSCGATFTAGVQATFVYLQPERYDFLVHGVLSDDVAVYDDRGSTHACPLYDDGRTRAVRLWGYLGKSC